MVCAGYKDGAKIRAIIITITNCDRYSNKLKIENMWKYFFFKLTTMCDLSYGALLSRSAWARGGQETAANLIAVPLSFSSSNVYWKWLDKMHEKI